jgi:hypothetical protein
MFEWELQVCSVQGVGSAVMSTGHMHMRQRVGPTAHLEPGYQITAKGPDSHQKTSGQQQRATAAGYMESCPACASRPDVHMRHATSCAHNAHNHIHVRSCWPRAARPQQVVLVVVA